MGGPGLAGAPDMPLTFRSRLRRSHAASGTMRHLSGPPVASRMLHAVCRSGFCCMSAVLLLILCQGAQPVMVAWYQ
jgi:hypothetical protein